jgi:hypothetical protein
MSAESYVPILLVNGAPIEITGFSLDAPDSKIGVALSFDCVDPLPDVERGMSVDFSILENGSPVNLIVGGFVVGRNKSVGSSDTSPRPSDTFSFTAADSLGERRFNLAPRIPLIYFDPEFVSLSADDLDTKINDETGARIYVTWFSVPDLDLYQVLDFAYVTGCGFSSVVTNIPNFPVNRQDFPLTSSFHKSVSSLYAPYKPMIFEDGGTLFIINARGSLPAGFDEIGEEIRTADYIKMERSKPERTAINALLLTTHPTGEYGNFDDLPGGVTFDVLEDSQSSGDTLTNDFQQTVFFRHVAYLHEDSSNPSRITDTVIFKIVSVTTGQDENGDTQTLITDTQNELFDYSFRRNIGYSRIVEAFVKRPGELAATENVLTESLGIVWASTGNFGEFIKVWEIKKSEGLIMVQGEDPDIIKSVLTDANRFGSIPEDATVERGPINTKMTRFRETGPDQIELSIQETDHLAGRPVPKSPQHHTGTIRIQLRGTNAGGSTQTLLRDEASEALDGPREPITFDGGSLPFDQALPLAEQALADAKEPPETLRVTLLKPDFSLRRGQRRQVAVNRNDNLKLGFVTGYSLRGTPAARGMCLLTQEVNLVVIN